MGQGAATFQLKKNQKRKAENLTREKPMDIDSTKN